MHRKLELDRNLPDNIIKMILFNKYSCFVFDNYKIHNIMKILILFIQIKIWLKINF